MTIVNYEDAFSALSGDIRTEQAAGAFLSMMRAVADAPPQFSKKFTELIQLTNFTANHTVIFTHFLFNGGATALTLQEKYGIGKHAIYDILRKFETNNLIHKELKVGYKGGGRKATLYVLEGATPESINKAISADRVTRTPVLLAVGRITQNILTEYVPLYKAAIERQGLSRQIIRDFIKKGVGIEGYRSIDIEDMIAHELASEHKVKVLGR